MASYGCQILKKSWAKHSEAENLLWWLSLSIFSIRFNNSYSFQNQPALYFRQYMIVDSPVKFGFISEQFLAYYRSYCSHPQKSGVPVSSYIFFMIYDSLVCSQNKGFLRISQAARQPTDQISTLAVYFFNPNKSSGALYHKVTTLVVDTFLSFLARPKSAILMLPKSLSSMFDGLISLWEMLSVCRYSKPVRICFRNYCILQGVILQNGLLISSKRSQSIKSRQRQITGGLWFLPFSQTTYLMFKMFWWFNP